MNQQAYIDVVEEYAGKRAGFFEWVEYMAYSMQNDKDNPDGIWDREMNLEFALSMVLDMASFSLRRKLGEDPLEERKHLRRIARVMVLPDVNPALRNDVALYAKKIHGIEDYRPEEVVA